MLTRKKSKAMRILATVLAILMVTYNVPAGIITPAFAIGDQDAFTQAKPQYTVTVNQTGSGKVVVNNTDYVKPVPLQEGTSVAASITPDPDFEIQSVTINGQAKNVLNKDGYTETIPSLSADTTIDVMFVKKSYTITFHGDSYGTIRNSADQTIQADGGTDGGGYGSDYLFTVTPADGYHVLNIKIDGKEIDLATDSNVKKLDQGAYQYTLKQVTANHTVEVANGINTYHVTTAVEGGNGVISPETTMVQHGSDLLVTITPVDNTYKVGKLTINGTGVDLANDALFNESDDGSYFTYLLKNITGDTTVNVTFAGISTLVDTWDKVLSITTVNGEKIKGPYQAGNQQVIVYSKDARLLLNPIAPYYRLDISDTFKKWQGNYSLNQSTAIKGLLVKNGKNAGDKVNLGGHLDLVMDTLAPIVNDPALSGENQETVGKSEWYSGKVTVTGTVDNPEQNFDGVDYSTDIEKVYYNKGAYSSKVTGTDATYDASSHRYSFETVDDNYQGVYSIWAVDQAGNVSDIKTVNINIDKNKPTLAEGKEAVTFVQTNDSLFAKTLHFLTFGTFFNSEMEIAVMVKDDASGIKELTLKTSDDKVVPKLVPGSLIRNGLTAEAKFKLDAESFKGTFTAVVTDNVNNTESYLISADNSNIKDPTSGVVMMEKNAPEAEIAVTPAPAYSDGKDQYNRDVTFAVTTSDSESGLNTVKLDVNGITSVYDYTDKQENGPVSYTIHTNDYPINPDGSYVVTVNAVDNAGNTTTTAKTIYIDRTSPAIAHFAFSQDGVSQEAEVRDSVELTEYGFFFKKPVQVSVTAEEPDVSGEFTSGVKSMFVYLKDYENGKYYTVRSDGSLGEIAESEIGRIAAVPTTGAVTFTAPENFKGQIFAKMSDYVGNTGAFQSPDGTVMESEQQHAKVSTISLEKENTTHKDKNGLDLYAKDVPVSVVVSDPYSGIAQIDWSVTAPYDTTNNQSGTVTIGKDGSGGEGWQTTKTDHNLVTEMTKTLTVKNDSNAITVKLKLTDRVGNTSEKEMTFSIDKTAPSIAVTYDNNTPDKEYSDFYKADRTATIVVTERNFRPEDVQAVMTNTQGVVPKIAGWRTAENATDPNKTTHTATVKYSADGDYTFDIKYKDNAENAAAPFTQQKFTLDKTIPVITVSYNNHKASNGNFYKTGRTATISINEHNFDPNRVKVTGSASDHGNPEAFPVISGWTTNGDVHKAVIQYAPDGKYSFDIDFTDKAGNVSEDYQAEEFYVDQTAPALSISGVNDQSANKGDVAPVISFSDNNFNKNDVSITLTGANRGPVESDGSFADSPDGQVFTFNNFAKDKKVDDLYTLKATLVDLAGNTTTKTIRFSVNRFGSVYTFDDSLKKLEGKYVKHPIDVVLTETNVDSLKQNSMKVKMTKNGAPGDLAEGRDYTVTKSGGSGQWSQYKYVVNKDLFTDDGKYTVTLYSEDAAGNINENIDETKKAEISFGVDKTAPVIIPIDFENGRQYPVENKSVNVSIKDNLVLQDAKIYLNGKMVAQTVDGENNTFTIPSSNVKQNVKIVAVDAAGNEQVLTVHDFLVTTNPILRWYNNTPLFMGSIGGVGVILLATSTFFLSRKKKAAVDEGGTHE